MRKILQAFKKLFSRRQKKEKEKPVYICDAERNWACSKEGCWTFFGGPCRCTKKQQFARKDEKGHPVIATDEEIFNLEWVERQITTRGISPIDQ